MLNRCAGEIDFKIRKQLFGVKGRMFVKGLARRTDLNHFPDAASHLNLVCYNYTQNALSKIS